MPIFPAPAANPRFLSAPNLSPLATAVLEVKGTGDELPAALRPLLALGLQQALVLEVSGGPRAHDARLLIERIVGSGRPLAT